MTDRTRPPSPWPGRLLGLGLHLVLAGGLYAQEPPAPKPVDTTGPVLSSDAILAKIKEAEDDKELAEELKKKLLETWKETLAQTKSAEEWAAKAAEFDKARQDAPALLESIRAELGKPAEEPRIELPPEPSLQHVEQLATQAEAALSAERKAREALEEESKRRTTRRVEVPKLVPLAQQRQEEVKEQLLGQPPADEPPALTQARRALLQARQQAIEHELDALGKEIHSYDARGELLTARLDRAARNVARAERQVAAIQALVTVRRRQEAADAAKQAAEARREAARSHEALQPLAQQNAQLAERRTGLKGLPAKIEAVSEQLQQVKERLARLRESQRSVEQKIKAAGLTHAMALLLRKERRELPDLRDLKRRMAGRQEEIADAQFQLLDLREQRSALAETEARAQALVASLKPEVSPQEREHIEIAARDLLGSQRSLLDALITDYDTFFAKLIDLDGEARQLLDISQSYATYIDERVLWLQSTFALRPSDLPKAWDAACWLAAASHWEEVARLMVKDLRRCALLYGVLAVALALLVAARPRLKQQLEGLSQQVVRADTDRFRHTARAAVLTVLLAAPLPALIGVAAFRLRAVSEGSVFARAISEALAAVFALALVLELLRAICRRNGLGDAHFLWRGDGPVILRRRLTWLLYAVLPILFVWAALRAQPRSEWQDSLGRMAFVLGMAVLSLFAHHVLRPAGAVMTMVIARRRDGWLHRFRSVLYAFGVAAPAVLAAMAVAGYYYSAEELEARLRSTAMLLVGLGLLHELLIRALFVVRRRLAVQSSHEAETAHKADRVDEAPRTGQTPPIYAMSQQAKRLVRGLLAVALIIGIWLTWSDALPALGIIKQVRLWPTTVHEEQTVVAADGTERIETTERTGHVTLADLVLACIVVAMTFVAVRNIPGLLEISVLHHLPIDHGVRFAITSLLRYVLIVVGIVLAFGTVGVRWSHVQWLVAAMTVGLGFGLQEIFANFVSGIIILFERPIRVGDTVTVGDVIGTVTKIRIRATTITDWDLKELVVPNKTFITGELINWSLSDPILRMRFPVGIAYGSDTALAHKVLLQVAKDNPLVLDEPAPSVVFSGFGDSALDFELRVFIPGMEHYVPIWDSINMSIDQAFREHDIEIAFPQRDIHIRSIKAALPIEQKGRDPRADKPDEGQ